MSYAWRKYLALFGAVGLLIAGIGTAAGAESEVEDRRARTYEPVEVVASGLDNPRHVSVDRRGRIWVAEAGRGGPALVATPLGDSDGPVCVGTSGALSYVTKRGRLVRAVTGLPSVAEAVDGACSGPGFGFAATGPHGIDLARRRPAYTIGLGGTPDPRALLAAAVPEAAAMGSFDTTARRPPMVDLAALEAELDSDGQGADSNPYGLHQMHDGSVVVADAGANTLTTIDRRGRTKVIAIFAPRCVPWQLPFPNPVPEEFNPCGTQEQFPAQPVPTGVAKARNGDFLVSLLGGFPFTPGYAQVYRIDHHHDGVAICSSFAPVPADGCEVFADGLTALVDVATDKQGTVYVTQFADGGVFASGSGQPGADAGSVKILHRRTGQVIGSIGGLTLPGGVAVDDHDVYISNRSIFAGGGELVRVDLKCPIDHRGHCKHH